jgi:hypothetical protein
MNKYDIQWAGATLPSMNIIQGRWRVRIVSGWLSPLYWLLLRWDHYKIIRAEPGRWGFNLIYHIFCLNFSLSIVTDVNETHDYLAFRYNKFIDKVSQINSDTMLGQIWVNNKMLGYFTMERK